jgi:hypothetical protein
MVTVARGGVVVVATRGVASLACGSSSFFFSVFSLFSLLSLMFLPFLSFFLSLFPFVFFLLFFFLLSVLSFFLSFFLPSHLLVRGIFIRGRGGDLPYPCPVTLKGKAA